MPYLIRKLSAWGQKLQMRDLGAEYQGLPGAARSCEGRRAASLQLILLNRWVSWVDGDCH